MCKFVFTGLCHSHLYIELMEYYIKQVVRLFKYLKEEIIFINLFTRSFLEPLRITIVLTIKMSPEYVQN